MLRNKKYFNRKGFGNRYFSNLGLRETQTEIKDVSYRGRQERLYDFGTFISLNLMEGLNKLSPSLTAILLKGWWFKNA